MQSAYPIFGSPLAGRRRASSSSSAAPGALSPSPLVLDPAYSNIITESPQSTSTSHVYPPLVIPPANYPSPYLPRTPSRQHQSHTVEDSLSQVDESGTEEREYPTVSQSSRAPLLVVKERDYAEEGDEGRGLPTRERIRGTIGQDKDEGDPGAYVFVDSPAQTPGRASPAGPSRPSATALPSRPPVQPIKQRTVDPVFLPRPGPADAYISRFLAPIPSSAGTQPPSPEPTDGASSFLRPAAPLRAASAPGVPLSAIQTSALPGAALGPPAADEDSETHPLFKIFSAQLDVTAEEMVRRLKGHLGEVLKVQEEVGGMHLKLEGLGKKNESGAGTGLGINSGGDKEEKPADGVKDMVDKREKGVEEIMEKLGILSDTLRGYHHLGTPKLSFPPTSKPSSAYPYSAIPTPITPAPAPLSGTAPTTPSGPNRHPPGHPLGSPPKAHDTNRLGRAVSNADTGMRASPSSPRAKQRHAPKVPSNLDQVTTADEDEEEEQERHMQEAQDLGRMPKNLALRDHEREKEKMGDVWLERHRLDAGVGQGFHSSPMEMADRSRPW